MIAEDFFQQFDRANLLGGTAAMRYRKAVLEPGGSVAGQRPGEELPGASAEYGGVPEVDGRRVREARNK